MGTMSFLLGAVAGVVGLKYYQNKNTNSAVETSGMFESETADGEDITAEVEIDPETGEPIAKEEASQTSEPAIKDIDLKVNVNGKEIEILDTRKIKDTIKKVLD